MTSWAVQEVRMRIERGETVTAADAHALVDALDSATRAAKVPSEFVVRVARDGDDFGRWTARHPLIQLTRSAEHPADALIFGAEELRRALANLGVEPVVDPSPPLGRVHTIDRHVADAHRRAGDGPSAPALGWALDEVDRLSAELRAADSRRTLLDAASSGDREAREVLRLEAMAAFERANVTTSSATWSTDALGDAASLGLGLPMLVLAIDVARHRRVDGWIFSDTRDWFALSHRTEPRPMTRYVDRIVTPLAVNDAAALSLHRLAPRVPTGRSVAAFADFAELMALELPEVDVGPLRDPLSPAWVPLPASAIPILCRGTDDERIDLDSLAEHEGWGPWGAHWKLAWVTDREGESDW